MKRASRARSGALTVFAAATTALAAAQSGPTEVGALTPPAGAINDRFGDAVAICGDTAAVGSSGFDGAALGGGAVYVFGRAGSGWSLEATLLAPDAVVGLGLGTSVDVLGDRLAAGAQRAPFLGPQAGAVYLFVRGAGGWSREARILPPDPAPNGNFGSAVELYGDTLAIGAAADDDLGNGAGAAYVFVREGADWVFQQKLLGSDVVPLSLFGECLALDGDTLLVGAPYAKALGVFGGAVYAFARSGTTWTETAKIFPLDIAGNDVFGDSVDLAGDWAVIGAPGRDGVSAVDGEVHVWRRAGIWQPGIWQPGVVLTAFDVDGPAGLGTSVAIDGDRILAGAPLEEQAGWLAGAVYAWHRVGTDWCADYKILSVLSAPEDTLGESVALDERDLLAGAPGTLDKKTGDVFAFRIPRSSAATYCTPKVASNGCLARIRSDGLPSASAGSCFLLLADGMPSSVFGLFLYGLDGPAALPWQGGTLCVQPPLRRTPAFQSGGASTTLADCSGTVVLDLNAWIQSGVDPALVPGAGVNVQALYRDPGQADGTGVALTDALGLVVSP